MPATYFHHSFIPALLHYHVVVDHTGFSAKEQPKLAISPGSRRQRRGQLESLHRDWNRGVRIEKVSPGREGASRSREQHAKNGSSVKLSVHLRNC